MQPLSSSNITYSNSHVVSKARQNLPKEKEIDFKNIKISTFSKLETKLKEELKINKYDSSLNLNKYVYEHTQEFLKNLNKSKLLQLEKIVEWTLKELTLLVNDLAFTSTTVETIFEYVKKIAKLESNSYTVAYRITSILSKITQSHDFDTFLYKTKIYETLSSYFKQYIDDENIDSNDYIGEFGAISQFSVPGICYSGIISILENNYLFSEKETKKQFEQIITPIKNRNMNSKFVSPAILIEFGKAFAATFNFAKSVSKNLFNELNDTQKHLVLSGFFLSPIVDKTVYNFLFQSIKELSITDLKYEILKRGYITKLICYIIHFTKSIKNMKYSLLKRLLEHELYIYKFSFHYLLHQLNYTKNNKKNATCIWQTLGKSSNKNPKNKEKIQSFFKEQFKTEPKLSLNGTLAFVRLIPIITKIINPISSLFGKTKRVGLTNFYACIQHFENFSYHIFPLQYTGYSLQIIHNQNKLKHSTNVGRLGKFPPYSQALFADKSSHFDSNKNIKTSIKHFRNIDKVSHSDSNKNIKIFIHSLKNYNRTRIVRATMNIPSSFVNISDNLILVEGTSTLDESSNLRKSVCSNCKYYCTKPIFNSYSLQKLVDSFPLIEEMV